jgi:hypothetical protein
MNPDQAKLQDIQPAQFRQPMACGTVQRQERPQVATAASSLLLLQAHISA